MWEHVGMDAATTGKPTSPRQLTPTLLKSLATGFSGSHPVSVPRYDRTKLSGGVVHLGVGGFHRAHLAVYLDDLAESSASTWSITGSGVMAHDEKIASVLSEQGGLYLLAEREGTSAHARIIGSLTDFAPARHNSAPVLARLVDPATKIVSLTVTEGGYPVEHSRYVGDSAQAAEAASETPRTTFGIITVAQDRRRNLGLAPLTVLSCDNLPGNGNVARVAVLGVASERSAALATWLETYGAFPNAMVDRITPATTDADRAWVASEFGIEDAWPVVCEPFRQWALEDTFACGRPEFENAGVLMTSDVIPYEHMKLRLLNGSHSGLAYHAALAGITYVHDAVLHPAVELFIRELMSREAAPNLEAPAGIDLVEYQNSLVQRFSNPAIADTIARLCLDGTAKFPTFIVPSLEDQLTKGGPISMLTLVLAGWCRYLRGVADNGSPIVASHDPFLNEAIEVAKRSASNPAVFLNYERALGSKIGASDRLLASFTEALGDLDRDGSLVTLQRWGNRSKSEAGPR